MCHRSMISDSSGFTVEEHLEDRCLQLCDRTDLVSERFNCAADGAGIHQDAGLTSNTSGQLKGYSRSSASMIAPETDQEKDHAKSQQTEARSGSGGIQENPVARIAIAHLRFS